MLEFAFALGFAGLVTLTHDQRQSRAEDIREALKDARISISEAADLMQMHKSDLCNALAGLNKLDDWRLAMMPLRFHQWLTYRRFLRYGLPKEIRMALKAVLDATDKRKEA